MTGEWRQIAGNALAAACCLDDTSATCDYHHGTEQAEYKLTACGRTICTPVILQVPRGGTLDSTALLEVISLIISLDLAVTRGALILHL